MRGGRIEPRSKAKHDHCAFERHKKAKQDLHPSFSREEISRRPVRAARDAPQYKESGDGDNSPSSNDDDTEDYRVEHRKRKSTDKELDDDNLDVEEEEEAPPVQHPPQVGWPAHSIRYGMLEVHSTKVPNYVTRVNYKAKGMTERAKEQRRIDPKS